MFQIHTVDLRLLSVLSVAVLHVFVRVFEGLAWAFSDISEEKKQKKKCEGKSLTKQEALLRISGGSQVHDSYMTASGRADRKLVKSIR